MANRLEGASSPYLRQHKDNPVDWTEWGEPAFTEAARRDVPVLLSIGYSACHWCHVMAHESFEDAAVAEVMNAAFVCVKVDREERPDVDAIYMDAVQAMTGRGGWPMTVFLTPDGRPFYGGTYYPRETFLRLLDAITDAWTSRRDDIESNAEALMAAVREAAAIPAEAAPARPSDGEILEASTTSLLDRFDRRWGGFGSAPKFPPTFALEHLMRDWRERAATDVETAVVTTLDAMAAGGIRDHIGGGFARYSVDERWLVPHFEKMLYDQAQIARAYLHAWQLFGLPRHLKVLEEILAYVGRELTAEEGGFYCSEDADSPGPDGHSHEGIFYTWTPEEVRAALGPDADRACRWWGVTPSGNFDGRSIPHRLDHRADDDTDDIDDLRRRLHRTRDARPRPGLDDKILAEWTAMMVSTLAEASAATGNAEWAALARDAAEFLVREMRVVEPGRDVRPTWMRVWHRGADPRARVRATAHDLAHIVDALTRMYELSGEARWISFASETAEILLGEHWDPLGGCLFTVSDRADGLVVRAKDYLDNATPSANAVAAVALLRLAALTGREDFRTRAEEIIEGLTEVSRRAPTAICHLNLARRLRMHGVTEIVVAGRRMDLLTEVRSQWRPEAVVAWGEPFDSPLWQGRSDDRAHVCRDFVCAAPSSTVEQLRSALRPTFPS